MHAAVEACGRFIARHSPEALLSPGTVGRIVEEMQAAFDRVLTPASVDGGVAVGPSVLRRLRLEAVAGIRVRDCLLQLCWSPHTRVTVIVEGIRSLPSTLP